MDTLLKSAQVARILNISKSLAYRLMQEGKMPVVRIGRSVRVRQSDLAVFIENNVSGGDLAHSPFSHKSSQY